MENLDGLYLGGINERAFLVSPDAVFLDGQLRDDSKAASAMLRDEGTGAFTKRAAGQSAGDDEFMQDELF